VSDGSASSRSSTELGAVLDALARIEGRLDRLEGLAGEALGGGRDAVGMLTDMVDRKLAEAQARGLDIDQRLSNLKRAAEHLSSDRAIALLDTTFARLDRLQLVLDSGVLDGAAVAVVANAGRALADAAAEPRHGVGPLGLVRALGERDVRAALGLLLSFARRMGSLLHGQAPGGELAGQRPRSLLASSEGEAR
jgi:uncharacterized protein YjgD (DUF1641 family)